MTKPKALRAIVLVAALVVPILFLVNRASLREDAPPPAAGGEWTTLGGNAARTGEASGLEPMSNPAVLWQVETAQYAQYAGDGMRLAAARGGRQRLRLWQPLRAGARARPGDRRRALARGRWTGGAGRFRAVHRRRRARGALRRRHRSEPSGASDDSGPPGAIYALEAATGRELWRHSFGEEITLTPPAVVGSTLYVAGDGYERGVVYAFDAATGAERWKVALGEDVGISEAGRGRRRHRLCPRHRVRPRRPADCAGRRHRHRAMARGDGRLPLGRADRRRRRALSPRRASRWFGQ